MPPLGSVRRSTQPRCRGAPANASSSARATRQIEEPCSARSAARSVADDPAPIMVTSLPASPSSEPYRPLCELSSPGKIAEHVGHVPERLNADGDHHASCVNDLTVVELGAKPRRQTRQRLQHPGFDIRNQARLKFFAIRHKSLARQCHHPIVVWQSPPAAEFLEGKTWSA